MNYNYALIDAILECESVTGTAGHTLGKWHKVTESMYISMCLVCSEITWVTQVEDEKHWRIGGTVLEQDCSEDGLRSSPGN